MVLEEDVREVWVVGSGDICYTLSSLNTIDIGSQPKVSKYTTLSEYSEYLATIWRYLATI